MSKNKKIKPTRDEKARAEAKQRQIENMPMNKDFLYAKDDKGNLKYPISKKLYDYTILDLDKIEDIMRQIAAYIVQIRHHENRIKRLQEQYDGDKVIETDEHGRTYTREEIQLRIISEQIAIPRDVAHIREYAVHKLLPLIDGVRLTGEMYNGYIESINSILEGMGYKLFPEKPELIIPKLE